MLKYFSNRAPAEPRKTLHNVFTGCEVLSMASKSEKKKQTCTNVCFLWPTSRSGHGEHWGHLRGADLWPHYCRVCGHYGVCVVDTALGRDRWGMPPYLPSPTPQTHPSRFPWHPANPFDYVVLCVCWCVRAGRFFSASASISVRLFACAITFEVQCVMCMQDERNVQVCGTEMLYCPKCLWQMENLVSLCMSCLFFKSVCPFSVWCLTVWH